MKKNGIIKALIILFLVYAVCTWIIPTGVFESSYTVKDTMPVGLLDLVRYPIIALTSSVFILTAVVILFTGGLYSVLNKTEVYQNLVRNIASKFEKRGNLFLVISIILFALLASLTSLTLPLFVMMPFFVSVILLLGYSKITSFISTIGAILVGNMTSIYGTNIVGYLKYFYSIDMNDKVVYRIISFILFTGILIFITLMTLKKEKVKEEEIPLLDSKTKTKKSSVSMIVIFIITICLVFVGMYNGWSFFEIDLFDNIYESITGYEINGYPLFANLLGGINKFGNWTNYELALVIFVVSFVIGWIYKLSTKDILSSFIEGCKKMLPVALISILANIIFLAMNATDYSIYATISNFFFTMTDKLNAFTVTLSSLFGGILYNDFPYMINSVYQQVPELTKNVSVVALNQQLVHGLVNLVAPTSVILVAGLAYLDIPYTKWLKAIWKYALIVLMLIIVIIIIIL